MNRKRIKLPSGLEFVRPHIAAVSWRGDGYVYVYLSGSDDPFMLDAADIAPFREWWDAPKAKRVKADATPYWKCYVCGRVETDRVSFQRWTCQFTHDDWQCRDFHTVEWTGEYDDQPLVRDAGGPEPYTEEKARMNRTIWHADATGFIGTDMCECGHNWGGHNLRGAPSDSCGQCGCRSFRLATPEPPAEPTTEPVRVCLCGHMLSDHSTNEGCWHTPGQCPCNVFRDRDPLMARLCQMRRAGYNTCFDGDGWETRWNASPAEVRACWALVQAERSAQKPPAEPKRGPWVVRQTASGYPCVRRADSNYPVATVSGGVSDDVDDLADRVARLLNESEVTG